MFSTLALGLGLSTVALAHEGGDEMHVADELIAEPNAEALVYQPGSPPMGSDRRRISTSQINDLLDLQICGNTQWAIQDLLYSVVSKLYNKNLSSSDLSQCNVLKSVILPYIKQCVLETSGISHTVYAGFALDRAMVISQGKVVGAFIDSDGREGCFSTECWGAGANVGVGVGVVGGVLFGDGNNDFPGVGYGAEVGGDFGYGYDFAGGLTSGGVPYVEVSAGGGIGYTLGLNACWTSTN